MNDTQLLKFHKASRDAIRSVLAKLNEKDLHKKDPQRKYSIAEEIGHLVAAEHWFLADDLSIEPGFGHMNKVKGQKSSKKELLERLTLIEKCWPKLLRKYPNTKELRVIIARMALHTLYHLARIVDRRVRMDPSFSLPHWSKPGSWEYAIEPLLKSIPE